MVPRSDQYVGITTWSGDNVDGRKIDMGMSPDLIWVKTRNQWYWHWLTDTVRGAPNKLYSNSTNAEDTTPIYGQLIVLPTKDGLLVEELGADTYYVQSTKRDKLCLLGLEKAWWKQKHL